MKYSVIPDTAPFTTEQRAWLNGFLAGWIGLEGGDNDAVPLASATELLDGKATEEVDDAEDYPWHDPNLDMAERLALAEGRPHVQRLMSAMAQLDCGACGYV